MVIIALGPPGRIRTIPDLGVSDDIPNLYLKVSSELIAMCSTDQAVVVLVCNQFVVAAKTMPAPAVG